eukprot:scaffold292765_cov31-Prasinocladus_malaysianus.AAC.1
MMWHLPSLLGNIYEHIMPRLNIAELRFGTSGTMIATAYRPLKPWNGLNGVSSRTNVFEPKT